MNITGDVPITYGSHNLKSVTGHLLNEEYVMNLPEMFLEQNASANSRPFMNFMIRSQEIDPTFYDETRFRHMLRVERMRTERSQKPFLLLLFDISKLMVKCNPAEYITRLSQH